MRKLLFFFLFSITIIIGCNSNNAKVFSGACTDILLWVTIDVVDLEENPVSGLLIRIVNQRTERLICEPGENTEWCVGSKREISDGTYIVVDSNDIWFRENGDVRDGETILVSVKKGEVIATEEFILELDASECHPERLIGLDQIIIEVS